MTTPAAAVPGACAGPPPQIPPPEVLALAGQHLATSDPGLGFTVGDPSGPGWTRLDHLDPATVSGWIDAKVDQVGGHRGIATGWIAEALARRVVAPTLACWATAGCLPGVRAGDVVVHRSDAGLIDRTAFRTGLFAVPVTDPAAVDPWAWPVSGRRDLPQWLAVALVQVLEPLFGTVRAAGRYGRRGLWGLTADSAGATLVRLVRRGLLSPAAAVELWADVDRALGLAARLGVPLRSRPRVGICAGAGVGTGGAGSGGLRPDESRPAGTLVSVRSICCLFCDTRPGLAQPVPDRYCTSCPRLSDADRAARLAADPAA